MGVLAWITSSLGRPVARGRDRVALARGLDLLDGFEEAALLLHDEAGRILHANAFAAGLYGRSRAELARLRVEALAAPGPWRPPAAGDRAVEELHERADGATFPVERTTTAVVLDGRRHLFTVVRDRTEERLAEAALTAGIAHHRAIVENVQMIQFRIDADGRIAMLEGRGLEALGVRPGRVVGRHVGAVCRDHPDLVADAVRALAGEAFASTRRIAGAAFDLHWVPLRREGGDVFAVTGVGLDVTDRVRAEEGRRASEARLVAAERLASMGRLAAGVAHEINNPLAWMLSNLDVALGRPGARDRELQELLGEVRLGVERVRDIARDLRVFARSDGSGSGAASVAEVVRAALAMVGNEIRHRARLETRIEPVAPVAMPERQLSQVVVNLLVNAAQSMPAGAVEENLIAVRVDGDGERVRIEVQDSGCGMAPEVRRRIFEPFYTTKTGEGMGLGLALCQTMVREAGGSIDVESTPGRGSTFRLVLPTAAAVGQGETPAPAPPQRPPPHPAPAEAPAGARLLVVDDEPMVCRTVVRALPEHRVEWVTDAREAVDRVRRGERWDAILCDLMMPEMTGMELAARVAEAAPALADRIVFLTGGAFTERARAFLALTRAPVVEKPFEQRELRRGVAAALAPGLGGGGRLLEEDPPEHDRQEDGDQQRDDPADEHVGEDRPARRAGGR